MPGRHEVVDDLQECELALRREGRRGLIDDMDRLLETIDAAEDVTARRDAGLRLLFIR
jgi:hypothetical protein